MPQSRPTSEDLKQVAKMVEFDRSLWKLARALAPKATLQNARITKASRELDELGERFCGA
jgi:hypothetical protein